jgi:hypothetical protein
VPREASQLVAGATEAGLNLVGDVSPPLRCTTSSMGSSTPRGSVGTPSEANTESATNAANVMPCAARSSIAAWT